MSPGTNDGSWIPGHPTKGVGGPPSSPTFRHNPGHLLSLNETSKFAVVLSRVSFVDNEQALKKSRPTC